jgi:hypothetical protein
LIHSPDGFAAMHFAAWTMVVLGLIVALASVSEIWIVHNQPAVRSSAASVRLSPDLKGGRPRYSAAFLFSSSVGGAIAAAYPGRLL